MAGATWLHRLARAAPHIPLRACVVAVQPSTRLTRWNLWAERGVDVRAFYK